MFIDILKYLFLGIVQGITEIIPVSSSGHLALFQSLLNVNPGEEVGFAIFVHFASLLALIIFFFPIILKMITGLYMFLFKKDKSRKDDAMLVLYLIIATIPAALVGFFAEEYIEGLFGKLLYVGIAFIMTSIILQILVFLKTKNEKQYTFKNTIFAGIFQVLGIIPGISRSGVTLLGSRVGGLEQSKAKEFTFLLFIPIALGSFIVKLFSINELFSASNDLFLLYSVAMVASFIFTYLGLIYIFKKFKIIHARYFSFYLVIIGIFTIVYHFVG
jgi:undecaprenyl-diphosphatase